MEGSVYRGIFSYIHCQGHNFSSLHIGFGRIFGLSRVFMLFLTLPGALIAILAYDRAPQPLFQIKLVLNNKIESKLLQIKGTHLAHFAATWKA